MEVFTAYDLEKQAGLFILKLKEIYKVSQTSLDGLIPEMNILIQQHKQMFMSKVQTSFSAVGIETGDYPDVIDVFSTEIDPFKKLHSGFLQETFF